MLMFLCTCAALGGSPTLPPRPPAPPAGVIVRWTNTHGGVPALIAILEANARAAGGRL